MGPDVRLGIVILAVRDLPRAVAFYQAAFGWEQTVSDPVNAEFAISPDQRFGLYRRQGFGRCTGQIPVLALEGELAGTELFFFAQDLAGTRPLSPL